MKVRLAKSTKEDLELYKKMYLYMADATEALINDLERRGNLRQCPPMSLLTVRNRLLKIMLRAERMYISEGKWIPERNTHSNAFGKKERMLYNEVRQIMENE